MFHALARFSIRFRWIIVVVGVLAVPVVLRTLPALSSVVQSDNTQFFPSVSVAPGLAFHLTSALAQAVDAAQATTTTQNMAGRFSLLLIIVLLPWCSSIAGTGGPRGSGAKKRGFANRPAPFPHPKRRQIRLAQWEARRDHEIAW